MTTGRLHPAMQISSSEPGHSLVFVTLAEYAEYKAAKLRLIMNTKKKIRQKYGIWASNQERFVATEAELNEFDSREFAV